MKQKSGEVTMDNRTMKDEFGQAMLIRMIQQEDFRNLLFLGLKQVASNNKAAHPVPFNLVYIRSDIQTQAHSINFTFIKATVSVLNRGFNISSKRLKGMGS